MSPLLLTKVYFKLIQVTHHIHITQQAIDTKVFPKGMMKQVTKLTQFIKPACPNHTISTQIADNVNRWMEVNMQLLLNQYLQTKDCLSLLFLLPLSLFLHFHRHRHPDQIEDHGCLSMSPLMQTGH